MKRFDSAIYKRIQTLRIGMFMPLAFLIASIVACFLSYSVTRQKVSDDLNEAMLALTNENTELWTRQDTIVALRQMHAATHKPVIFQASDLNFKNEVLRNEAYFSLALIDKNIKIDEISGNRITSDSIMFIPEKSVDGLAIKVQGFADCSMASLLAASDQTVPGIFFALSLLSMAFFLISRRQMTCHSESADPEQLLDNLHLTPMQRRFTLMLLNAPCHRVDKSVICAELWDSKSNAEESLYTLVRRTKVALAHASIEIICNRGESYELRVKG